MKKLSKVYKEAGIAFTFPIVIEDSNSKMTYYEYGSGYWHRYEYDENGNENYYENSQGHWCCYEYDENSNITYYESSSGYWFRKEYDEDSNQTYYEDSYGEKKGTKCQSCDGKVIEVNGKKYKLKEI